MSKPEFGKRTFYNTLLIIIIRIIEYNTVKKNVKQRSRKQFKRFKISDKATVIIEFHYNLVFKQTKKKNKTKTKKKNNHTHSTT